MEPQEQTENYDCLGATGLFGDTEKKQQDPAEIFYFIPNDLDKNASRR